MYKMLTSGNLDNKLTSKTQLIYLEFGFGIPLVSSIIAFSQNWLGNYDNVNCADNTMGYSNQTVLNFYSMYIPRGLTLVIIFVMYARAGKYLGRMSNPSESRKIFVQTFLFPVVYLISCMFLFASDLYVDFVGEEKEWMSVAAKVMIRLLGLLDALIYGFNPFVQKELRLRWNRRREYVRMVDLQDSRH